MVTSQSGVQCDRPLNDHISNGGLNRCGSDSSEITGNIFPCYWYMPFFFCYFQLYFTFSSH